LGFPTATESLEPTDRPTATQSNFATYESGTAVSLEPTDYPIVSLAPSASVTVSSVEPPMGH
jgi:hypothetical protein